jgi:hypothetical protein
VKNHADSVPDVAVAFESMGSCCSSFPFSRRVDSGVAGQKTWHLHYASAFTSGMKLKTLMGMIVARCVLGSTAFREVLQIIGATVSELTTTEIRLRCDTDK